MLKNWRRFILYLLAPLLLLTVASTVVAEPDPRFAKSKELFAKGETSSALVQINKLLAEDPRDYRAGFLKAQILTASKQYGAAIDIYEALIQQVPDQLETYNNLAMLYAAKGDLETARQLLEKAIKSQPAYSTVYDNLSKIYVEMARDSYGKALKLNLPREAIALASLNTSTGTNKDADQSITVASANTGGQSEKIPPAKKSAVKQSTSQQSVLNEIAESAAIKSASNIQPATKVANNTEAKSVTNAIAKPAQSKKVASMHSMPINNTLDNAGKLSKDEVITTLQGWAAAWSAQQVDLYLSFYDEKYHPTGMSRNEWIEQRKQRVKRPKWVQITLKDFEVAPHNNDRVVVKLVQRYRSEGYHDKTRKQFLLQNTPDGWRIMSELSLALLK